MPLFQVLSVNTKKTASLFFLTVQIALFASAGAAAQNQDLIARVQNELGACKPKIAIARIDQALKSNPRDARLHYWRARCLELLRDLDGVMKELKIALSLDPNYAEAYLLQAKGYFYLSELDAGVDYSKAGLQSLDKAIKLDPKIPDAYDYRGTWMQENQKFQQALQDFNTAIELNPKVPGYHRHRALALNSLGERQRALSDLIVLTKMLPMQYENWLRLSEQYESLKMYKQARECLDKAIVIKPHKLDQVQKRAVFLMKLGQYNDAIADLDKLIKVSDMDDELYNMRGEANFQLKQYDLALKDFNQAIKLHPELGKNYLDRARLYKALHKDNLAKLDEAQANRLSKKSVQ